MLGVGVEHFSGGAEWIKTFGLVGNDDDGDDDDDDDDVWMLKMFENCLSRVLGVTAATAKEIDERTQAGGSAPHDFGSRQSFQVLDLFCNETFENTKHIVRETHTTINRMSTNL